jgi:DNA-binding GntR family transcriptional regulator
MTRERRTPVREALRLLVHAGWAVILPRKGYLVKPLALGDVREIFALRRMLEPPLAAEVARHATDDIVDRLRALLAEQSSIDSDFDRVTTSARDLHALIAESSGNSRAVGIVTDLIDEVVRLIYLIPRMEVEHLRSLTELETHAQIVDAIARGDAEAAEDLMRAHIVLAGQTVTRMFTEEM